jgi:hypothetical protein
MLDRHGAGDVAGNAAGVVLLDELGEDAWGVGEDFSLGDDDDAIADEFDDFEDVGDVEDGFALGG